MTQSYEENYYKFNKNQALNPTKKIIQQILKIFKYIEGLCSLGVCFPVIKI